VWARLRLATCGTRGLASDAGGLYEIFGDREVMRFWSRPPFDSIQIAREFLDEIHAGFAWREGYGKT
jgi:hypothetical protein